MRHSTAAAILFAACAFATPQISSAAEMSPYSCKLVYNGSPYFGNDSSADYQNGKFVNGYTFASWAMCPMPITSANSSSFEIDATDTNMTCYLVVSNSGGNATYYNPSYHVGGVYRFTASVSAYSAVSFQCLLGTMQAILNVWTNNW